MKKLIILITVLAFWGCDKDSTGPNNNTYSTSNLEGIWMGTVVVDGSALPDGTIIIMGYEFDSQGNLLDWIEGPEVLSLNSNLDMSEIGDITGTTTTIHINGNNAEETTICNWQGSQLVSINTIEVNMQCDWTTNDESSGSYSVTGSLNKSTDTGNGNSDIEIIGTWSGTDTSTGVPVDFTIIIGNSSMNWNYGGDPLSADVTKYDNSSNYCIVKWTNHPAFFGTYQKFVWLTEPAETVSMLAYSEEATQDAAENSTTIPYPQITITKQ